MDVSLSTAISSGDISLSTAVSVRVSVDFSLSTAIVQPWIDIDRTGFVNNTDSSVSFNDSTYVLTLTGTTWSYYKGGLKYTISGNKSVTLPESPPTAGSYYVTIDGTDGTLTSGTTPWSLLSSASLPVAMILWNNSNTPKYILSDERHTSLIDRQMHAYLHYTRGTQFVSGGVLDGPSLTTQTDAGVCFGVVGSTVIADDDIFTTLLSFARPSGTTTAYNIYYRTNSTTWSWQPSEVPFKYSGTNYIEYDLNGNMTSGVTARWYNTYLLFTDNDSNARFSLVSGRNVFTSLLLAQAENPLQFDWTGFPVAEAIIAYQFTWNTNNAYTNKGKCRLAATPVRLNISTNTPVGSGAGTDHNTLAGLQGGGANEYYHLTNADYLITTGISTTISTADASLSTAVSSGDLSLSTAISTRASVDVSLSTIVSTLDSETTSLSTAVSSGDLSLSTAVSVRTSVDVSLSTAVSSGDLSLSTAISTVGGTSLSTAISSGNLSLSTAISVRTSVDVSLSTAISSGDVSLSTAVSSGDLSLSTAVSVRTSVDVSLSTAVSSGDLSLSTAVSVRTSVDVSLSTAISSGDLSLSTVISSLGGPSLSTAISSGDLSLSTAISVRTSVDVSLSTAISSGDISLSTAISVRTSVDVSLSTAVSSGDVSLSTAVSSGDLSLSTAISVRTSVDVSLSTAISSGDLSLSTAVSSGDLSLSTAVSVRTSVDVSLSTAVSSGNLSLSTAISTVGGLLCLSTC